jgi:glycosyltransferase involved in cell wall biosynthesis
MSMRLPLTIGVVITVAHRKNHANDALHSVLNQTKAANEILVVDCVASGMLADTVGGFREARYIRHDDGANIATTRNIGIAAATSDCLLFVDSNDLLLPRGIETGLSFFEAHPEIDVALFDFQWTDETGRAVWPSGRSQVEGELTLHLLAGDRVFAHSSTCYRRRVFDRVGGFNPNFAAASDRDLLLRAVKTVSVAVDSSVIAKCRPSIEDPSQVLLATRASLEAVDLHGRPSLYENMRRRGIARAEAIYGELLWERIRASIGERRLNSSLFKDTWEAATAYPQLVAQEIKRFVQHRVGNNVHGLGTVKQKQVHHLRQLARLQIQGANSVSMQFGYDRGQPLDRYYIERFLGERSAAIRGRVLEIKNSHYTRQFGGDRVTHSDVLHPDPEWPEATIHGNLTDPCAFGGNLFDCVILTQTLHLIYDMRAVLRTVVKILKPGGILLATAPCISKVYRLNEPAHLNLDHDSWRLTRWSFGRLLGEFFPSDQVEVDAAGNLAVNAAFLYGLAVEDLPSAVLQQNDSENEMILLAMAVKQG